MHGAQPCFTQFIKYIFLFLLICIAYHLKSLLIQFLLIRIPQSVFLSQVYYLDLLLILHTAILIGWLFSPFNFLSFFPTSFLFSIILSLPTLMTLYCTCSHYFNDIFRVEILCYCCSIAQSCATLFNPMDCSTLSVITPWSLLKLMSIESVMPSNHLVLCHHLLLPSIFSSIRAASFLKILMRDKWNDWKSYCPW